MDLLHKISGLFQHRTSRNEDLLPVVVRMAEYLCGSSHICDLHRTQAITCYHMFITDRMEAKSKRKLDDESKPK